MISSSEQIWVLVDQKLNNMWFECKKKLIYIGVNCVEFA